MRRVISSVPKSVGIAAMALCLVAIGGAHVQAATPAVPGTAEVQHDRATAKGAPDFVDVVRRFDPAVVNISVSGVNPLARKDKAVRSEGSGFIVAADGIIMTNAHVIKDARHIVVKLKDMREFPAKVIGSDPMTDIAVLKIDAQSLPTVVLGHDHSLESGQWVLAIGSPYGFEHSVSAGVVSGKRRTLGGPLAVPLIQSDVAVNPGNSGGPLFNAAGEVVGINAAIYSGTGGYEGLSFSIPIDLAVHVKDQILQHGFVTHARAGLATQSMDLALAKSFKLDQPKGALVLSVDPQGPAQKAGLRAGDVVLMANGHAIQTPEDLPGLVGVAKPGDLMNLQIWREGHAAQTVLKLEEAKMPGADAGTDATTKQAKAEASRRNAAAKDGAPLGLALRHTGKEGLTVTAAHGPALEAGINKGDRLLAINGEPVTDLGQAKRALSSTGGYVALLMQRGAERAFVPITVN